MSDAASATESEVKPAKPEIPVILNLTLLAARLSATRASVTQMVLDGGLPIDAQTPGGDPLFFESSLPNLKKIWLDDCWKHGSESRCRKAGLL